MLMTDRLSARVIEHGLESVVRLTDIVTGGGEPEVPLERVEISGLQAEKSEPLTSKTLWLTTASEHLHRCLHGVMAVPGERNACSIQNGALCEDRTTLH